MEIFNGVLYASLAASILIAVVFTIKRLLGNKLSANWHYVIWFLLILKLLVPLGPGSQLSVYNYIAFPNTIINQNHSIDPSSPDQVISLPHNRPLEQVTSPPSEQVTSPVVIPADKSKVTPQPVPAQEPVTAGVDWRLIIAIVWLCGVIVFAVIHVGSCMRFRRKLNDAQPVENLATLKVYNHCLTLLNIKGSRMRLVETDIIHSPALYGMFRPAILLPQNSEDRYLPEQLRYVLLHELAHYKRKDIIVQGLCIVLQTIHWFNPLIWYAFYKMRLDAEIACDEQVLKNIEPEERKNYGNLMINLLAGNLKPITFANATALLGKNLHIKERIKHIASFRKNSRAWSAVGLILVLLLGGVFLTHAQENLPQPDRNFLGEKISLLANHSEVTMVEVQQDGIVKQITEQEDIEKIIQW